MTTAELEHADREIGRLHEIIERLEAVAEAAWWFRAKIGYCSELEFEPEAYELDQALRAVGKEPMTDREQTIDFTRGAMDRLRELAGSADAPHGMTEYVNGWDFAHPGVLYQFRIFPHGRLFVRASPSKTFRYVTAVQTKAEALEAAYLFMRGVDP